MKVLIKIKNGGKLLQMKVLIKIENGGKLLQNLFSNQF
jgi:hypothetical protein